MTRSKEFSIFVRTLAIWCAPYISTKWKPAKIVDASLDPIRYSGLVDMCTGSAAYDDTLSLGNCSVLGVRIPTPFLPLYPSVFIIDRVSE